jgi:uncharacterized BrkB/YihY/UPF0761 family membrane protein
LERRALEGFEQAKAQHMSVQLAAQAFEHDRSKAGGLLAGGLAYRIFLWEIPLSLFLVSLFGLVSELSDADPADLARQSGMTAALSGAIAQAVEASNKGRVGLLILGAVLTIWAGRGVVRGLQLVCALAWGERGPRRSSLIGSLLVTALGLGALAYQAFLPKIGSILGIPGPVMFAIGLAGSIALMTWVLVLLPHGDATWQALLPGAVLLGVGFRLLGLAVSTYFAYRLDRSDDLYGSLAIAVVMMLYLFVIARLFVAAQFLNASLHRRRAEPAPAA